MQDQDQECGSKTEIQAKINKQGTQYYPKVEKDSLEKKHYDDLNQNVGKRAKR